MEESLALKIREANMSLISNGNLDRVGDFFTSEYTVHLTDRVMKGGHSTVQGILRSLRGTHTGKFKNFPASGLQIIWRDMVTSQFCDGLITEEWVLTDLAEQLLLSRKPKS